MYWLTGIAGVILMAAPFIFKYTGNLAALWTSLIAGFVVLVVSLWEGFEERKENWEYWTIAIIGLLAVFAPFVLGFSAIIEATWATIVVGAVLAILAGSKLWMSGPTQVT